MYTNTRLALIQIVVAAIVVSACSSVPNKLGDASILTPQNAINLAAEAAPRSVPGVFELAVKGTGRDGEWIWLNSEEDYRDQRSLNIGLHPKFSEKFAVINGMSPDLFFEGQLIRVSGKAKRARIDFVVRGQKSGLYYYQTQIRVTDLKQIEVVPNDT